MASGFHPLIPRNPNQLQWKRGPLPTPLAGLSILVFRPHFDLRCAPSVLCLTAVSDTNEPYELAWWYQDGPIFRDELTEDDWWTPLGPDAVFVLGADEG